MSRRTPTQLRDAVVARLRSQIGYTSGTYVSSIYGLAKTWASRWAWGTEWQGMYCNRFTSWGADQVLGARAARAAIGHQAGIPQPAGFSATWLQREWHMANGRHVGFANSQPGDHYLFKLPGRPLNPTNHIGVFVRWHIPGKVAVVVEGNLPRPGHGASTIGVWEHYRDITYVVGVYRPNWEAAAAIYNAQFPEATPAPAPAPVAPKPDATVRTVQSLLAELGYDPGDVDGLTGPRTTSAVRTYQTDFALTITGNANTTTLKSLEDTMTKLNDLEKKIDRVLAAQAQDGRYIRTIPLRVWREDIPFIKGTSLHDLFGDKFRAGALAGYAAASHLETPRRLNALATRITAIFGKKIEALAETRPEPGAVPAAGRED